MFIEVVCREMALRRQTADRTIGIVVHFGGSFTLLYVNTLWYNLYSFECEPRSTQLSTVPFEVMY